MKFNSIGCMRAFVWDFQGSQIVPYVSNKIPLQGTPLGT